MEHIQSRTGLKWWALAIRGVLAILFGLVAFFWPGLVLLVFVYLFAIYAFADGILAITAAVTGHGQAGPWWALLLEGIVGIAAGVLAVVWPGITELALLFVIAGWSLVTGVFEIVAAVYLRRYMEGEWTLALSGVLSVILGLALVLVPAAGLLVIAWWVGAYAIAFGALLVVLAFQLRGLIGHASGSTASTVT
jgi:uncharacterized membrane protein HdeD (DUF308 family)